MLLQHHHVYTLILESHNAIYRHLRMELLMHNHRQPTQLHLLIPHTHLVQHFHNQRIPHHSLLLILLHRTQHVQHIPHHSLLLILLHRTQHVQHILHHHIHLYHHIHLHLKLHPTILEVTKWYIFKFFPIDTDIHPGNNF